MDSTNRSASASETDPFNNYIENHDPILTKHKNLLVNEAHSLSMTVDKREEFIEVKFKVPIPKPIEGLDRKKQILYWELLIRDKFHHLNSFLNNPETEEEGVYYQIHAIHKRLDTLIPMLYPMSYILFRRFKNLNKNTLLRASLKTSLFFLCSILCINILNATFLLQGSTLQSKQLFSEFNLDNEDQGEISRFINFKFLHTIDYRFPTDLEKNKYL